jgi:FlaA1/EpsC-like NDP-sugar epimerase
MSEATGIQAWAAASEARRLFIIDAGGAVPVAETARRVSVALRPGAEPRIAEIGIRLGERLHEELSYEHETLPKTSLRGVLEISHGLGGVEDSRLVTANVAALEQALDSRPDAVLRAATFAAARGENAEPVLSAGSSESRR